MAINPKTGLLYVAGSMDFNSFIYVRDTATILEFGSSLAVLPMAASAVLVILAVVPSYPVTSIADVGIV